MYNVFKNKVRPYFFHAFSKSSYELVSEIEGKEEVYCRDGKLVVVVKDYKIGNRIYSTIKSLSESETRISTGEIAFSIGEYFVDKYDRIEMFYVNFENIAEIKWNTLFDIQKLQYFVAATASMESSGYRFDNEKFDNSYADSFSGFISFFEKDDENQITSNYGSIIKYIHYMLSECDNFDDVYYKLVNQNQICAISSFKYALPVIRMCYNFVINGQSDLNTISKTLEREAIESGVMLYYADYSIVGNKDLSSNFPVTEKSSEYTVYDGCIKIFNNMSSQFEDFLRSDSDIVKHSFEHVVEKIDTIIIDCNSNIIGYKFSCFNSDNVTSVLERNFGSQSEIFSYITTLSRYISKLTRVFNAQPATVNDDFDIERDMVCYATNSTLGFKVLNPTAMFNLATSKKNIDSKIVDVFFKIYAKYLNTKYGEISDEKEYFAKPEIRYLTPTIAKAFVDFALSKTVNYFNVAKELFRFMYESKRVANNQFVYDSRFEYNPEKVPFTFDYEVKEKYGINIYHHVKGKDEVRTTLPDGRVLVSFNGNNQEIGSFARQQESRKNDLLSKLRGVERFDTIKVIDVSEIIYSKTINAFGNQCYEMIGFITTPYKGKVMSDEFLLNLSNKDFFRLAGNLFYAFDNYCVARSACYIDDDFNAYIDIFNENFRVEEFNYRCSYVSWLSEYLVNQGYNANAFVDVGLNSTRSSYLAFADSLDAFCDDHKIFYNSKNKMCPVCAKAKMYIPSDFESRAEKLFEDEVAVHYAVDYKYSVKIYKESFDKTGLEENVDAIIAKRLLKGGVDLNQDCFVPIKKAVDENNRFVGYTYVEVPFKARYSGQEYCVDIADINTMRNLPRLKSLTRLISQVQCLIMDGYCFIQNPFGQVFLNKGHKHQVQILNIEFLKRFKKRSKESKETEKWTCEYVYSVLAKDDTLDLSCISNHPTNLQTLLNKLSDLADTMTRYCPIHKMYYKEDELFCPRCVDRKFMKNIKIEYVDVSDFSEDDHENEGGESFIYPYGEGYVAKIFKEKEIDYNFKNLILARVLSRISILNRLNRLSKKVQYVIPQKILVDRASGRICGYTMKRVEDAMPLSNLRDKDQIANLRFDKQDTLEILINAGEGIEVLHSEANMFIGDLNGRNILFDRNKTVYFLDFDGMGADDIVPMFWTEGYIDPVSKKTQNITMKDDWYSFAIQAFYYLTFTHPFNGIYYVNENGRKVKLEIPDKMERRMSLLGNHGIKVPDIAVPWNWMLPELQNMLLNIFEGSNRESIVPVLKKQYKELYGSNEWTATWDEIPKQDKPAKKVVLTKVVPLAEESFQSLKEESPGIIRISPKFVAKAVNPFNSKVTQLINPFSAVCGTDDHIAIIDKNDPSIIYEINIRDNREVKDILLLEGAQIAWIIYENKVVAMDLNCNQEIYCLSGFYNVEDAVVNGNTLYFLSEGNIIHLDYKPDGTIKQGQINFLNDRETKHFFARHNSKYIIIKRSDNSTDDIFCNAERLCDIEHVSSEAKYRTMYDSTTRMWLIVSSEGTAVAINASTGEYEKFDIQAPVNDINIDNLLFVRGKLYIPTHGNLYIVNVKNQAAKKMECPKIMTPDSKLFDINSSGYSVATNCNLYEVRKG